MSNILVEYVDYDKREISTVKIPIADEQYKTLTPITNTKVVDGEEIVEKFVRIDCVDNRLFDYVLTQDIGLKELKELIGILQHLSRQICQ